jgi:uncharacterized protein (TIGR01244 family)
MVKIIQLEPDIAVAPQLVEADFADIAARSFRTVVNNRPDGEAPDQLPNTQAAAAAHRHGLEFRYHPVRNLNVIDDEVVDTFARLMEDLPEPIVFYCGTGARRTILWTLAAAGRLGVDEALAVANKGLGFSARYPGGALRFTRCHSSAIIRIRRLVVSWPTRGDLYTCPSALLVLGS